MRGLEDVALPGPDAVGWSLLSVDGHRILLFYPARGDGGSVPTRRSEALARRFGDRAAADLAASAGPARHRATPMRGDYPLILFAPGAGLGAADYRWLLAGLASRGMLVAGLDPEGSPPASETQVVRARDALAGAAGIAPALDDFGRVSRVDVVGHSIGGAAAVAALGKVPGARAVDIDGDFLGASRVPAGGPVLLLSGRNPDEPARAEKRREADWRLVANGTGRRLVLPDMRHLGVTDAALLPAARLKVDLGPRPAAVHREIGEAVAVFLSEGR